MWISKKRWQLLEKKIADLEVQVQSQQEIMMEYMNGYENETNELKEVLENAKKEIYIGVQQIMEEITGSELP